MNKEFDYKQRPFSASVTDEQYDRAVGRKQPSPPSPKKPRAKKCKSCRRTEPIHGANCPVLMESLKCRGKTYVPPNWVSVPCGTDGQLCRKCRAARGA